MPKKEWTPEERAAFAEKMKAARANKQPKTETKTETKIETPDLPTTMGGSEELIKIIEEMKSRQALLEAALLGKQVQGQQITDSGIEGTREKFDTDPTKYPDYTDRLNQEPRLSRFGFKDNYRLMYEVKVSRYQRADGVWEQQPRFIYQLWGKRVDDTGEYIVTTDPKTGQKMESLYGINQYIFHEDPEAFFQVARDAGLNTDALDMDMLQAEGRYMQVLDWLLGCFYPEAAKPSENRTEMVIGNRLVEVKQVAVEDGTNVKFDFSNMKKL